MPFDIVNENKVYTHPGQEQMQVEVILASRHADMPNEKPLYTVRLRYPRIIHGEIMTHRVFGRNARSSRAVPVKTMLNEVRNTPFVPWHWGKNQKGMQADEECNASVIDWTIFDGTLDRVNAWCQAATQAASAAAAFMDAGYHKQLVNRLLEPFSWIDVLITSNRWDNFLWLRDHGDAEPHLQDLARLVKRALDEAVVHELDEGMWHMPYITEADEKEALTRFNVVSQKEADLANEWLNKLSAARCARISYKPFDGDASYEREIERYNLLVTSERVHASPLEHQAMPDRFVDDAYWEFPELHGNLPGWCQARKFVPNECHNG
jgi:thymidylate synthase ThyX